MYPISITTSFALWNLYVFLGKCVHTTYCYFNDRLNTVGLWVSNEEHAETAAKFS